MNNGSPTYDVLSAAISTYEQLVTSSNASETTIDRRAYERAYFYWHGYFLGTRGIYVGWAECQQRAMETWQRFTDEEWPIPYPTY